MYHRFSSGDQDHPRHLPAAEFARQLEYIRSHHEVWTPDQQLSALSDGVWAVSRPPVVITIDDGYLDFHEIAFPLLREFSLPAMVFLTTGFVSRRHWFWWDRLSYILSSAPAGRRRFNFAGRTTQGDPSDPAECQILWRTIADHLSTVPDEAKESTLDDLAHKLGASVPAQPPADYSPVTWEQVRDMANRGIEFGAHTLSHPILSRVDQKRAWEEISQSREELFRQIVREIGWFCYPQGLPTDFLPETVELVKKAGFRGCYTAFPDASHDGSPYTLPRYSVSGDEVTFRWILCGAEYLLMKGKARLAAHRV